MISGKELTSTVPRANFFRNNKDTISVAYILNEGYCNAHCSHCYVNIHGREPSSRNIEEAKQDIERLKEQGYRVLLRGTEILINPSYLSLFPIVEQNYLQTNGIIISQQPSILNKVSEHGIDNIILTYPFLNEISSAPIDVVEKAVKECKNDFSVTLSIIITNKFADNSSLLGEACEQALDLGARAIKFIRLMPINPEQKTITLNEEESGLVLREINSLKHKYSYDDLIIQTPGCFGQFNLRRSLNRNKFDKMDLTEVYDCPAGICHFVIDTNNNIFSCLYLMDKSFTIGNYTNKNLSIYQNSDNIPWGKLNTEECPAYQIWRSRYD